MLVKVDFGNVARKVKDIATKLGLIDDYIVAHGTSGIWTYRKWNSGVYEAWGNTTKSITFSGAAWNMGYAGARQTVTVPIVKSIKYAGVSAQTPNGALVINVSFSDNKLSFYPINDLSNTVNTFLSYYVVGTWK